MGDGGVACVPAQHVMERFSICGGKSNGNSNSTSTGTGTGTSDSKLSSTKMNAKTMKKVKKVVKKKKVVGLKSSVNNEKETVVSNGNTSKINSTTSNSHVDSEVNKDEVEEGELGTLPIENGDVVVERATKKYEIRSVIEKGEIGVDKWRKGGEVEKREISSGRWRKTDEKNESSVGSWRTSSKDELEKGEFVQDRWQLKDDFSYSRTRRYDYAKDKSWKCEREWTTPPPPPPSSSGKYSSEKELSRSANQQTKRGSRYEGDTLNRTAKISSKIVDEDGYELSNGKCYAREYSSGNRLKRQGVDTDIIDRKHRGDCDDYKISKSRKLSDNGTRTMYSSEHHSHRSGDRLHRNATSSSRNIPSDRYSSKNYESSRPVFDKYKCSPHHSERSPHGRARYHDHRVRSPAYRDRSPYDHSRSPYDRSHLYDRSRSPYDRNHHYGRSRSPYDKSYHYDCSSSPYERSRHPERRKHSPSYSEWSPQDQARYQRDRTPSVLERSPSNHGRPREPNRKSGTSEKRHSYGGSRGAEEKPNQKDPSGKDLRISAKESEDRSHLDIVNGSKTKNLVPFFNNEEPTQVPDTNAKEVPQENGSAEELISMEEDMDICNTPPHVPVVENANTGKWFYLDHLGKEQGPSRLSDLKKLVEEGFLVSDHLIKHLDSDRWVTVEKAVSPLVSSNFPSIVSETITQLVSPPEASGNVLVDNGDSSEFSNQVGQGMPPPSLDPISYPQDHSALLEPLEDLNIDERVGAFLDGYTVIPGRELEMVGEVLQMTSGDGEWERWRKIEGFTWHQLQIGEYYDQRSSEVILSSESTSGESVELRPSLMAPSEKDSAIACESSGCFSGHWSCKGGDWKRNDEAAQDRSWRRKFVLNDGYPLCQMPKSGNEDPRWQHKDELYHPSQSRSLDLPPWAFTSPDEWNDTSVSRSGQSKLNIARGVRGMMLPVVRINACVVKDHDTFVSEPRVKSRGKERYSSKSSRNYSVTSETKRSSSEGLSRSENVHELYSHGSWKSSTSFSVPKDRICTADELQLNLGEWYYIDGAGHERGPLPFSELQVLADQGVIQKHSSAFRKVDKIWVPVTSSVEASGPSRTLEVKGALNDTSGSSLSEMIDAILGGSSQFSSMFHSLHPQFIGYTRGKLHELVMKSYKSREFAAAINEVLDPWINARQPKKEIEKSIYNSALKPDQMRASKRLRLDGSEDEYEMEDVLFPMKDAWSFDEICSDANFSPEKGVDSEIVKGSWVGLEGQVLARIFHFLRADERSLVSVALTCKLWRSVLNSYKKVSRQVDLSSIAPTCNDAMLWSIMNGYTKEKISTLVLRDCTNITSGMVEEVLQSFMSLSSVDIRGCSQLEDLAANFPNINWISGHGVHSKTRSLKHITDKTLIAFRTFTGLGCQTDDSSGLRDYLESSDRRDSANRLFRQSLYKRSKLFDARKSSSILSRDAHLRRLALRKSENGYKRVEQFLALSLKDIMKENTFDFFVPKVAEIENRMRSGYYASRGLSSVKEDISRMCRDAIKSKNRGDARNINRIITLFICLATSLEGGSKSSFERDTKTWKEDSPPGFSSTSSKHKKKVIEKKHTSRSNGFSFGVSDYGDYASDREIRRRLSKLNKKSLDSGSETSDDLDRSSDESLTESESTASDTESDPDIRSESGTGESRGETYFPPDDGFDSLTDEREWGARMTKAGLVPPVTRKYEVIDHYVIVADEVEVKRKMQVSLPEDYAEKLSAQRNGTEESDMEIPEVKEYRPRKQLGYEVIEQEVYGIDPYTHNLLLDSIPESSDWSLLDKHVFIEDVLLRTLNKQVRQFTGAGNTPMTYPLKPLFEEILETAEDDHDWRTVRVSEFILKAVDSRPDDNYVAYRKGLGVVCNKEGGFSEEDFIVEFLGEVYPAWKWFEKQDGIRSLQKNNKDPAPEFYNIYLERPKGDADGYDLVVVDAMHKANYASRICHSCRPNCEAKVTAVDGQYQIGIYAVRPIRYGEEITFDYNSVTESKEEYEASVCLCGSQVCRGSYLNLTGDGAYQKVLKDNHGILDRHQLMLEACELNSFSEEDYIDLLKAGLGSCLLDGLPDWLIAYSARLVRFINFERIKLPKEILRHSLEEKKKYFADISMDFEKSDAELQAEGVYNQRLQNLALTLDKVRYVMRCVFGDPKRAPPPLERLNLREAVSYLWNSEESLVEELIQCIAPHLEDSMLNELKANIRAHDPSDSDDIETGLRKSLTWLRDEVRNLPCTYKCRHDAAADLIHIYAHTKFFFRIREYKTVTSPPVYISPLDLCPKYADKLGSQGHDYCKTYGENYCLGQLIFWHNQGNAEPDSSLARSSRGCLTLPEIGSFYAKVQKPSRQRVYGPRTLKFMLSRMEKQPQRPWPKDRIWSFTSTPKIIGSPMLDSVLNKAPLDKEMVHWLKNRPPIFQAMWDR